MTNRLLINPGTPQTWEIKLKPGLNRIGRSESNDFTINHPSVSTHHCEITVTDTSVTLRDLGSINGTFVERVPVSVFQLHNGQHVQFGSVDMRFDTDMSPTLPSPAVNMPGAGAKIVLANPGPAAPPPTPPPIASSQPPSSVGKPMNQSQSKNCEEFAAEGEKTDPTMFLNGLLGAICGGLVGMFGWYLLIFFLQTKMGYPAIMVGAATGAGARLLVRRGSRLQGIVCAVCALFAIIGGQYLALASIADKRVDCELRKEYNQEINWAQSAVEATNETDVTNFLSVRDKVNQSSISADDIKKFQEKNLPNYRDLLNGKPSKEEYVIKEKANHPTPRVLDSIDLFTIIWSLFGIVGAWQIGSGNKGSACSSIAGG